MHRLPAELESRILGTPGVRIGRTLGELMGEVQLTELSTFQPPPAFADEKQFQAAVVREAEKRGWRVYHTHDSRKSRKGYPDITAWRERVLFAELKTEDGALTADQANTIEDLRAAGAEVHLWRPDDWPAILATLAERGG